MKVEKKPSNFLSISSLGKLLVLLGLLFLVTITWSGKFYGFPVVDKVYAVRNNPKEDTAKGTASKEIEMAIAKGKELIGKTDYWFGGGHSGVDSADFNGDPPKLDCSSFVYWCYYKGAGVDISGNGKQVMATGAYASVFTPMGIYERYSNENELNRGDLVLMNGNAHVQIYLGDGKYMGMEGNGGAPDTSGGADITDGVWTRQVTDGIRVNMKKAFSEGGKSFGEGKAEALKDGEVSSKDTKDSKEGNTGNTKFQYFEDKKSKINPLGMENKGTDVFSNVIENSVDKINNFYGYYLYIIYAVALFFISYSLLVMVLYLTMPLGMEVVDRWYEKLTGHQAYQSKKETIDIFLGTMAVCICSGLILAQAQWGLLAVIYTGISYLMDILMNVGGVLW